jgi:PPM family protein phosphatase
MATSAATRLIVGALTDVGSVRTRNEDSILVEPTDSSEAKSRGWLCIVADGLGGHRSGDVASQLAISTTRDNFYAKRARSGSTIAERLRAAIEQSNEAIVAAGMGAEEQAQMASTITAAVIDGTKLVLGQVGDSRGYLIRNSRVRQVTRDHSLVEELIRSGSLTPEEALHHPNRNVITRALGTRDTVEVDVFEEDLHDADVVLLCSDGLYRVVGDGEIARALIAEPQAAAESLVALANQRGGPDNISVIIVRVMISEDADATLLGRS